MFLFRSAVCTCPSGYMGKHCEYRVDIHDDPFTSSLQIGHKDVGLFIPFVVILIPFAVVLGLGVILLLRRHFKSNESRRNMTHNEMSSCCDNVIRDNNIESTMEKDDNGECRGFSLVELL